MEFINEFTAKLMAMNGFTLAGFILLFLLVWFLPTLLASLFNRKHLGKIALLNIPAGFSWIAWVALIGWAATGKLTDAMARKAKLPAKEHAAH
ncbi:superinfection immunity protein [Rheinheimera sp.]|uniref:superinfection immunity protein n=1 Tax=Rheinheimera sp. TaxID=1869214 RepID=UPI00307DE01A